MRAEIIERLKTSSIKNVVSFGNDGLIAPPYIVVCPRKDPLRRGRLYCITVHYKKNQQDWLEKYFWKELQLLLNGYSVVTVNGNTLRLEDRMEDYTDIIMGNDDGTISMDGIWLMPSNKYF